MKSKILTYLGIADEVSDKFPQDVKDFVELIEGTQEIYAETTNEAQKEKLSVLIVQWMRELMVYLKTMDLGLYTMHNVNMEQQTLPKEQNVPKQRKSEEKPKPQAPKPQPPKPEEPEPPRPEPPQPEPPQPEPEDEELTKEEIEDAIASLQVLADNGDQEAQETIDAFKVLLENMQ